MWATALGSVHCCRMSHGKRACAIELSVAVHLPHAVHLPSGIVPTRI